MRILFMGSAELACPTLESLLGSRNDEVVGVVTQPDRPKGRNRQLAACPAKAFAATRSMPILTPEKIGDPGALAEIKALAPDLIVLVAYGQFLPQALLDMPRYGCINVHPSLLPRYRGAAPIQWAVANGDRETGVTILFMTRKMDAGDIILQEPFPIAADDTAGSLEPRLARKGAEMLMDAVNLIRGGTVPRRPQEDAAVTFAPRLQKEDGRINWAWPAQQIHHRVRGFNPWPMCFCEEPAGSGKYLRVLRTSVVEGSGVPGVVLRADSGGLLVATGDQALCLLEVQPEGKKVMPGGAFVCGARLQPGQQLG